MRKGRDILISLGIAVLLAVFLRTFIVSIYKIPSSSMQPTLLAGDFVIALKAPYGIRLPVGDGQKLMMFSEPERGEVFVFRLNASNTKYIKRVVALAGDKVEIKDDKLYVNDSEAEYQKIGTYHDLQSFDVFQENLLGSERQIVLMQKDKTSSFGPVFVPEGNVFVLGDNRDGSDDSRYWGVVSLNDIESKVFGIWLSLNLKSKADRDFFPSVRWSRMFQWLQ
jgi:signal peptidase I